MTQEKRADRAAERKAVTPGRPTTRTSLRDPLSLSGPGVIGNIVPLDNSVSPRDEEMTPITPSKPMPHEPLEHALTSNPWDGTHTNQPAIGNLESDPIGHLSQASANLLEYATPIPITIDLPESPPDPPPQNSPVHSGKTSPVSNEMSTHTSIGPMKGKDV